MSKTVKKVKKIPKPKKFTGLLVGKREPVDFTPNTLLDALGAEKENRPVWKLKPMTVEQRHAIQADDNRCVSLGFLWLDEQGISLERASKLGSYDEEKDEFVDSVLHLALAQYQESQQDKALREEVVRSCIVGYKGVGKFPKDEDGTLSKEVFANYPKELIQALFVEIDRISNLSMNDILGL